MPEVVIKHNVKDATPPIREPLPTGTYHAIILRVTNGLTNFQPTLATISIEFSVVKTAIGSVLEGEKDDKYHGRAVYQDYIIEPGTKAFSNQQEAFRIQQLVSATKIPHKVLEGGQVSFNTDHLISKGLRITLTQRSAKPRPTDDPKKPLPVFNNVDRVETEEIVADDALL